MTPKIFSDMALYNVSVLQPNNSQSIKIKDAVPAAKTIPAISQSGNAADNVQITAKKSKRKGPIRKLKDIISGIKKLTVTAKEYSIGMVKGLGFGTVAASIVYTGAKAVNFIKDKSAEKIVQAGGEAVKKVRHLPPRALAVITLAGSIAVSLWNASLNATQRQSEIDMRWKGFDK